MTAILVIGEAGAEPLRLSGAIYAYVAGKVRPPKLTRPDGAQIRPNSMIWPSTCWKPHRCVPPYGYARPDPSCHYLEWMLPVTIKG